MILKPYLIIKNTPNSIQYRVTKTPSYLDINEICIRLELDLPKELFEELFEKPTLEAKIKIPQELVTRPIIQAETIENVEGLIEQGTGFKVKLSLIDETTQSNS